MPMNLVSYMVLASRKYNVVIFHIIYIPMSYVD
jgi:hypothetical protein